MKDPPVRPLQAVHSAQALAPDEASGDASALAQRGRLSDSSPPLCSAFCYVRRNVRKCSQVDSHTSYV